jgi:hypothetical protein
MSSKAAPVVTGQGVGDNNRHISNAVASAEGVRAALNTLPFAVTDGSYIQGVSLPTGSATDVRHKLGRKAQGWLVLRALDGAAVLYEVSGYNTKTSIRLYNNSGANTTVDLWFF